MSDHPGIGVLLHMLGSNEDTAMAVRTSIGKTIASARIHDNALLIAFTDETTLKLRDARQSCCEDRYMRTDDDLAFVEGAALQTIEVRDGDGIPLGKDEDGDDRYGDHEVQFLIVTTSKGAFTIANHNEHNGYYGGFAVVAELVT